MIRLMVVQMGGTPEDARDIFQEGLMIILEKIDDRSFALTCKFKTFLYCICENLWRMILMKRKAAANYMLRKADEESEKDPAEEMDNELYQNIFREAFELLDDSGKKILRLYWEEKSPAEIAETLGYTYGYVRKKKSEAQAELTRRIKSHPGFIRLMKLENIAQKAIK